MEASSPDGRDDPPPGVAFMISGLVLAAGTSTRMGRPKPLLRFRGRPFLEHVVASAAEAGLPEVVVVLGHRAPEIRRAVTLPPGARFVVNPDYRQGQASSLVRGVQAVSEEARAVVILLADQPTLPPAAIRGVLESYRTTGGPVVRATYRGRPGHPVLLDRSVWPEVLELQGDAGARQLMERHPDRVVLHPVPGDPPPEVDTPEEHRRLLAEEEGA